MKILKYIGIGLLVVILLVLVIGLFAPKSMKVERSITINAPKDVVMSQVKSLKNTQAWSPWARLDPNMKNTYEGVDGEVGSKNSWEGNKDVGKGEQTVKSISENRVEMDLHFMEPMESKADVYYNFEDDKGATKVTWGMVSECAFPMNAMMVFMDMDAMIGKDFEQGLGDLKKICEAMSATPAASAYQIEEVNREAKTYIGKRETLGFADLGAFFGKNFPTIGMEMGKNKMAPVGAPVGIYFKWDEQTMKADVAAAMPVADAGAKLKGYETFNIPAGKALHIAYYGSYEKSADAHKAMDVYMKEKNLTMNAGVIEEYVTDPMSEKDTSKWLTNIYYMVN